MRGKLPRATVCRVPKSFIFRKTFLIEMKTKNKKAGKLQIWTNELYLHRNDELSGLDK